MNAILYARFSPRPNPEECDSVSKQLERCRKWCEAKGWTIAGEFSDEGKSGGRADNRPGLQRAISAAIKARAVLVFYSVDRLSRSIGDLHTIAQRLTKGGARLASITEPFDTSSPFGEAMMNMLGVFAQLQRRMIVDRTKNAMRQYQAGGRRMGSICPTGFENNCLPGHMQPNQEERRGIDRARVLRAEGMGWRSIAKQLGAEGIGYRGRDWTHTTIKRALERA